MKPFKDITGQRFGNLTAIKRVERIDAKHKAAHWLCRCECGQFLICRSDNLRQGHTKHCTNCSWVKNGNKSVFVEGGDENGIV